MAIDFGKDLFTSEIETKISLKIPADMDEFLETISQLKGLGDRSKTIRWCIEQVAKVAIEQGVFPPKKQNAS